MALRKTCPTLGKGFSNAGCPPSATSELACTRPHSDCRGVEPGWMDTQKPDAPLAMSELVLCRPHYFGDGWYRDWTLSLRNSRRKPTRDSVWVVDQAETPWPVTGQTGIGGRTVVVFIPRLRVLQLVCHHHLRQTPGLSSLLLGRHVPRPNPSSMHEGSSFLGDRYLAWWVYNSDGSAQQPPW